MLDLSAVPPFLATLLAQPSTVVLIMLLLVAAVIDWRTYRIPNWLTVGGMLFGLIYNTVATASMQAGLLSALAGMGLGLILLLPLYVMRVMGAGDVKLMAMVGAFVGVPGIVYAALYTLLAGGIAAVAFSLYHRAFKRMAGNVRDAVQAMAFAVIAGHRPASDTTTRTSIGKLPYGISISAGTIAWLAAVQLGYA